MGPQKPRSPPLPPPLPLVAATDTTIVGCVHGCAVDLFDADTRKQVQCSRAHRALDSDPAVPETVARLLLLHLLCG